MKSHRYLSVLPGLMLMLAFAGPRAGWAGGMHDHDRARQALEAGEVLPLKTVLDRVEREYPGQIMEVELDREDGRWVYEVKILRTGGALLKLKVDARNGALLGRKERNAAGRRETGEKP